MPSPDQLLNELQIDRRAGAPKKKRRWPWIVGALAAVLIAFLRFPRRHARWKLKP